MAKNIPLNFEQYSDSLPGEDRSFGGDSYYADLTPSTAWFSNLRTMMPISRWKELSMYVRNRHKNCCEICGSNERLEAHERWLFDKNTGVQRLMRIMCVCKKCHLSIHIGLASQIGLREEVESHIFSITGWTKNALSEHLKDVREKWMILSSRSYETVDVSIVENVGIVINDSDKIKNNIAKKDIALTKEKSKSEIKNAFESGSTNPLAHWIREGYVVVFPKNNRLDLIGSVILSDFSPCIAKSPNAIEEGRSQISLPDFIKAHNNPIVIESKKQIAEMLCNDPETPRRLIVKKSWVTQKLIKECFEKSILFSIK